MMRAVVSSSSLVRRGRLMMWRWAPTASTVDSLMARSPGRRQIRCRKTSVACREWPSGFVRHVRATRTSAPAEMAPRARVPSVPPASSGRAEAFGEGIHAGQEAIGDGDLAPTGNAELLAQDVGMRLHGTRRDAQLLADLLVREACRDELDDLTLAVRERRCSLRERLVHAAELTTCCTGATFVERSIRAAYFVD